MEITCESQLNAIYDRVVNILSLEEFLSIAEMQVAYTQLLEEKDLLEFFIDLLEDTDSIDSFLGIVSRLKTRRIKLLNTRISAINNIDDVGIRGIDTVIDILKQANDFLSRSEIVHLDLNKIKTKIEIDIELKTKLLKIDDKIKDIEKIIKAINMIRTKIEIN